MSTPERQFGSHRIRDILGGAFSLHDIIRRGLYDRDERMARNDFVSQLATRRSLLFTVALQIGIDPYAGERRDECRETVFLS